MDGQRTSGRRGRSNISIEEMDPVPLQQRASSFDWKRALENLFRSRKDRKSDEIAEKRAIEVKDIIRVLETVPFAESTIDPDYIWYNPDEEVYPEAECLSPAVKALVQKLKEPVVFDDNDDIHSLNKLLLTLAGDFSESVRVGDDDRAYFCLDGLRNMINMLRPRIPTIADRKTRRKYIEDVIHYGKLAATTSAFHQQKWDISNNLERLFELSEDYVTKQDELEKEYFSFILTPDGADIKKKLEENQLTIAMMKLSGDPLLVRMAEIAEDYAFMALPRKMATLLIGIQQKKEKEYENNIETAKAILYVDPTLDDEELYNNFRDTMNRQMEEAVENIVHNNERVEQMIAWSEYTDDITAQLVAGEKILQSIGLNELDRKLKENDEYLTTVPLSREELAAVMAQRRVKQKVNVQKNVQENVHEAVQENVQENVLENENLLMNDID